MRHVLRAVTALGLVTILAAPVAAQGARALGMGGVRSGAAAAALNPAYGAVPEADGRFELPLPLSLIALFSDARLDPGSDTFDAVTLIDQLSQPFTWILNPAVSPDEIVVRVGQDENGAPTVAIEFIGGSGLTLTTRQDVGYRQRSELLVPLPLGPVVVGLRPYVGLEADVRPDAGLADLFRSGASEGTLTASVGAEAGVALEVSGGLALPIPATEAFPGRIYVGGRLAPFVGLAKVDGTFSGDVATDLSGDTVEVSYSYQGDLFVSSVTEGQVGFGGAADLGVVAALDLPEGVATFGVGLRNLGFEWWPGTSYLVAGDESGGDPLSPGAAATRFFWVEGLSVAASGSFAVSAEALGTPLVEGLMIAADFDTDFDRAQAHVGVEAAFNAFPAVIFARGGIGFQNGFVFGVGTGVAFSGVGIDLALHGYRSPLSSRQAVGVTANLVFGY